MYSATGNIQTETYIEGNRTPSESVAPNYGVRTCGAYCVQSGSNGSVTVYFRFFARTYGTIGSTLQSALCSGTWGTTMAGTYLQGATGETWYYGTNATSNQYDYKVTLSRDGSNLSRTEKVGWYGDSGATYQSSVTLYYGAPCSVTYNANGGSGAPSTQTKYYNVNLTLSTTVPTKTGHTFRGWGTSASATAVAYAKGATYKNNAKLALFAIWAVNTYKITYNANGGSGAPSAQTKTYGKNLTLSTTKPTRAGYTFLGWSTSSTAISATYSAGGSYTANSAATLYAVWSQNVLTVNYYSNCATSAFSGAANTVGSTKNVLVRTQIFYYSTAYSDGLANYSTSSGACYLTRTGYTATGDWGTTTSGGTLVNENTSFATGQELAQALGKTLVSSSQTVNIYPQWTINSYYLDVNGLIDGALGANTSEYGTFDVYIGGVAKATGVTDFYQRINYGASYEITNITPIAGHTYDASTTKGALKGTMGTSAVSVDLSFKTNTITLNYRSNYATEAFSGALNKVSADSDVLVRSETYPAVVHGWETEDGIVLYDVAGYSNTSYRCYLARDGYNPTGVWGTDQSGGHLVKEGEGFVEGSALASLLGVSCDTSSVSVNLYPQWQQKNSWAVFLNTNGGEGTIPCPSAYVGESITLPSETPTRTNYRFLGWSASNTSTTAEYSPGDTIPSPLEGDSIVLYAVWQLLSISVYLSETWKPASAIWVYGSDGTPKKALSVTVYDSDGLPHTSAL